MRDLPISEMGLSTRPLSCLYDNGIKTVGEVMDMPDAQLLRMVNLGRKSVKEIRDATSAIRARMGIPAPLDEKDFIEWCYRNRDIIEPIMRKMG